MPGHVRPGVGELAGSHAGPEIGRERGHGAGQLEARDDRVAVAEVDDGADIAAQPEGVHERDRVIARRVGRQSARDEHGEVEPGLRRRILEQPLVERGVDEQVRADAEDRGGQPDQGDQRDDEAAADAAQDHLSGRPCSRPRAR